MLATMTREDAANRIETFAREGRLIQRRWHDEQDGRELACILGAIDRSVYGACDCPARIMPRWMATVLPKMFDHAPGDQIRSLGAGFARALRTGGTGWPVRRAFLIACVETALRQEQPKARTKSCWDEIRTVGETTIALLKRDDATSIELLSARKIIVTKTVEVSAKWGAPAFNASAATSAARAGWSMNWALAAANMAEELATDSTEAALAWALEAAHPIQARAEAAAQLFTALITAIETHAGD